MMRRIRFFTLAVALAIAPTAHVAAQTKPPATNDQERIRALYRKGAGEYAAGRYEAARSILLDAWQIRQSYDVASALGQAELELKRYREAAEHLRYAVNNFAPVESATDLEAMKGNLRQAKTHVAEVRLNVNAPGVQVFANNLGLGAAPFAEPVFLDPGTYQIEARRGSEVVARRPGKFEANDSYTVDLVVPGDAAQPVSSGLSTVPTPPPSTSDPTRSWRGIALVTGGSVAVAGLAMGIGFGIASNSAEDDANKFRSALAGSACFAGAKPSDCDALRDAVSRQSRDRSIANVGWAIGALGVVAVGVTLLWPSSDHDRKTSAARGMSLSWQGDRLLLDGTF